MSTADAPPPTETAAPAAAEPVPAAAAPKKKPGLMALIRQYGALFVFSFGLLYFITFGLMYALVLTGIDTIAILEYCRIDWLLGYKNMREELNPAVSQLAVTYVLTGITEPLRIAICVWVTPGLDRVVRANYPAWSEKWLPAQTAATTDAATTAAAAYDIDAKTD